MPSLLNQLTQLNIEAIEVVEDRLDRPIDLKTLTSGNTFFSPPELGDTCDCDCGGDGDCADCAGC